MSKRIWGVGLLLASLPTVCMGQIAEAVSLQLIPSSSNITVGQTVNIAVVISELGNQIPVSLSFYDLDISFNSSVLAFNNSVFGDPIFGDQLNLNNLGSSSSIIPGSGVVSISEASGDPDTDLDTLQQGSFTLATLSFNGLAEGNSLLNLSITELLDSQLIFFTADSVIGSSVIVNTAAIKTPEPSLNLGMFWLLLLSGFLLRKSKIIR